MLDPKQTIKDDFAIEIDECSVIFGPSALFSESILQVKKRRNLKKCTN